MTSRLGFWCTPHQSKLGTGQAENGEQETETKTTSYVLPTTYCFYFEGGIASYVRHLNHSKEKKHDTIFYFEKAVQLHPNFIDYLGNLAAAHRDKGDLKKYYELRNEYYRKYNLISSARVSQIQYGDDKMILEDVFILPVDE